MTYNQHARSYRRSKIRKKKEEKKEKKKKKKQIQLSYLFLTTNDVTIVNIFERGLAPDPAGDGHMGGSPPAIDGPQLLDN